MSEVTHIADLSVLPGQEYCDIDTDDEVDLDIRSGTFSKVGHQQIAPHDALYAKPLESIIESAVPRRTPRTARPSIREIGLSNGITG